MSRQNKAAKKATISNPQTMPRKHAKQFWKTVKGIMIARKDCNKASERAK